LAEKIAELREKIEPAVNKVGWQKIALAVVILALAYWLIFLRPVPGTLMVSVVEMDSGQPLVGTEVSLINSDGSRIGQAKYTDDNGGARFENAPSTRELSLEVSPANSQHKRQMTSVTLASGEARTETVEMERNWDLEVEAAKTGFKTGAGCTFTVDLTVTNKGNDPIQLEFVGEGGFDGLVLPNTRTLNPKTKDTFSVQVRAPAGTGKSTSAQGRIRAKYTSRGVSVSVSAVAAPSISVTPNSIEKKLGSDESSFVGNIKITVKEDDLELNAACRAVGQKLAGKASITDVNPNEKLTSDKPKLFEVTLGPFASGYYPGQIICETSCGDKTLNVVIEK